MPLTAASGSTYRIQIGRPSASDAFSKDVYIDTPTNGSFGAGVINSIKDVRVVQGGIGEGQLRYLAGDINPFRWFNAGDFGDTNLLNNDVYQTFYAAAYRFNVPPSGTDFFDAIDSCCMTSTGSIITNVFDANDANINLITLGDGEINVTDVFVIYRRTLDPSLKWFARYWIDGQRTAAEVRNLFRGLSGTVPASGQSLANLPADALTPRTATPRPSVLFRADDIRVAPGESIEVPIRAEVAGAFPLRVLLLNLSVEALEGSPALTEPIQFTPATQLGKPVLSTSTGYGNYAATWLDHRVPGVIGSTTVGTLRLTIPAKATANAAYRIHFGPTSASPSGLSLLPQQIQDGLLVGRDRSASSFGDSIPDTWRLRYFGSAHNQLSQAAADADGDGVSNWLEFKTGTNPADVSSQFRLLADAPTSQRIKLRWPSVLNKIYAIEAAPSISSAEWTTINPSVTGTGHEMELLVDPIGPGHFYRVRLLE
ncbi:MAG: hypothetical protein FJ403_19235 [Verrucomicrobia bacterium]|nr:hypothetical protein [Verrucomicrobiota bacterium]